MQNRLGAPSLFAVCFFLLFIFTSCTPGDAKFNQYKVTGETLYLKNCSNCHQKNGKGLGLVYPPLNQSDFMDKNPEKTLCLMKYGISGELTVNGKSYNKAMPGVPQLTDLEIAEIATYIFNSWGHSKGLIHVETTSKVIKSCDH